MNRKEKELKILNLLGLEMGDKITPVCANVTGLASLIFEVAEDDESIYLINREKQRLGLSFIIENDFKKLSGLKKGNQTCSELTCDVCPFGGLRCSLANSDNSDTLYKIFNALKKAYKNISYVAIDWETLKKELDEEI